MATLVDYNGLQVVDPAIGGGGAAIRENFELLVDWSPKSVWAETADPTVNDDEDLDFYPGSMWLRTNVTPPKLFVCKTSAAGAAVWQQVLLELIQDTTPQLGGDLDVNGQVITSASNGPVVITPNGTGAVGIGTSPSYFVHAKRDQNATIQSVLENASTGSSGETQFTAISDSSRSVAVGIESVAKGGKAHLTSSNSDLQVRVGGSTRMMVRSSNGQVFVGDTTNTAARGLPLNLEKTVPGYMFYTIGDDPNEKAWDFFAFDGVLQFRCVNDAVNAATTWLRLDRSGQTPTLLTISVPMTHQQTACPYQVATDGATVTFNLALSNVHTVTLGGNRTLAISNARVGQRFMVSLKQDATGSRTATWWGGISWPGGTVPTLTTTANKTDVFEFVCTASNTYIGRVWGQDL